MRPLPLVLLLRLSLLIAVAASAALIVDYQNAGDPAFCGVGSGCFAVRISPYSRLLGVPLPYIGLVARDQRPASNAIVRCGSQRSNAVGDSLSLEGDGGGMSAPVVNAFNSASLYSVALRLQGVSAQCAMIADATMVAAEATTSGEALTQAGIFVKGGTARFSYVLAIQRQ